MLELTTSSSVDKEIDILAVEALVWTYQASKQDVTFTEGIKNDIRAPKLLKGLLPSLMEGDDWAYRC